jgi:hypothetical protein
MPLSDVLVLIYIIAAFAVFAATLAWVSRNPSVRLRRSGRTLHKHRPAIEHR